MFWNIFALLVWTFFADKGAIVDAV